MQHMRADSPGIVGAAAALRVLRVVGGYMYKPWIPIFVINLLFTVVVCLLGYPPKWYFVCILFSAVPLAVELTHFLRERWREERRKLLEEEQKRLKIEESYASLQRSVYENRRNTEQLQYERQQREAERAAKELVYFIVNREVGTVKIGVSTNPKSRMNHLQIGSPHRLVLAATSPGGYSLENQLHVQFAKHRLSGEWFRLVPEIQQRIDIANGQTGRRSRSKTVKRPVKDSGRVLPA